MKTQQHPMAKPSRGNTCAYCGEPGNLTADHVPPKAWLLKPYPKNLVTVRACEPCNLMHGKDDEEFLSYLPALIGMQTPAGDRFWSTRALPAIRKNNRKKREFLNATRLWARSAPGQNFELGGLIKMPAQLYDRVGARLSRGLMRAETGLSLPQNTKINVSMLGQLPDGSLFAKHGKIKAIENFGYAWAIDKEETANSLWLFCFYDRHLMMVATGAVANPDHDE